MKKVLSIFIGSSTVIPFLTNFMVNKDCGKVRIHCEKNSKLKIPSFVNFIFSHSPEAGSACEIRYMCQEISSYYLVKCIIGTNLPWKQNKVCTWITQIWEDKDYLTYWTTSPYLSWSCARWVSPRGLLYNIVLIVSNVVSCTSTFVKRTNLMLAILNTTERTNTQIGRLTKALWEMLETSITLILVMVSWVFAYVQTHQIEHIKYV